MVYQPVNPAGGFDQAVPQINKFMAEQSSREVTEVFNDAAGTRRVLLGRGLNGFYGVRVAPESVDVYTAADAELIFSSDWKTFKIGIAGDKDVKRAASTDTGSATVDTGILSAPSFVCFVYNPNASPTFTHQTPMIAYNLSGADSGKVTHSRRALYDPSTGTVKFIVEASDIAGDFATAETWRFRYYLLFESIQ